MHTEFLDPLTGLTAELEPFSVTVARNRGGCVLAVVVGAVDANSLGQLAGRLADQPAADTTAVVLDLSRVPFCSVGGIAFLLDLLARTNEAGVPLELVVDTSGVRRPLDSLGLTEVFSTYRDLSSALDALGEPRIAAGRTRVLATHGEHGLLPGK